MNTTVQEENFGFLKEDSLAILSAINQSALVSATDLKGNIIYVNDRFIEVSKYSKEELIGQNHRMLKSGDQPDQLFSELWKVISVGKVWRDEIKNRAKDGTHYWIDTLIAPVLGEDGKPERYFSVSLLITDKKEKHGKLVSKNEELERTRQVMLNALEEIQVEKKKAELLAKDLEKFKFALDGISDQVVMTDSDGYIFYANAAVEKITGFTIDEVMGKKAGSKELWGGNMGHGFYEKLWNTIKIDKAPFIGEFVNKRKNKVTYNAHSSISPIFNDEKELEFIVGIDRDITKEKEIDTAKTEFVSLASHQLRTPLSAINWYIELLLSDDFGSLNDNQKKYLSEVYSASQRMVDLINALLNVSRLDLGTLVVEVKIFDIKEILNIVVNEVNPDILKKNLKLVLDISKDIDKMNSDPNLFKIILQNLINNSTKYTKNDGEIKVKIHKDLNDLYIDVQDNGYGIPEDQKDFIFTKLFRASNVKKMTSDGTGLGLYLVKKVIDTLKGEVSFESAENVGTVFHVKLPLKGYTYE